MWRIAYAEIKKSERNVRAAVAGWGPVHVRTSEMTTEICEAGRLRSRPARSYHPK
jgi:hypothetical protein